MSLTQLSNLENDKELQSLAAMLLTSPDIKAEQFLNWTSPDNTITLDFHEIPK